MTRRTTRTALLALAAALVAVSPAGARQGIPPPPPPPEPVSDAPSRQQQPPADSQGDEGVQLGAELVNVPFNATDKKGRPIVDLRKDEVQVLEDGKAQEIFSFERQLETPLTISLLIDTSGSQEATIGIERDAALRFFQKVLRPDRDLGSVITFSKDVVLEQELTNNLSALDRGLARARVSPASAFGRGGTAPTNPQAGGTSMFDAVYLAADEVLRREAGRRVIILVTDGVDTTSSYNKAAAIERAWRSEVIVYCVAIGDPNYQLATGVLGDLSKETGGRTFTPRGNEDLDKAFEEIQNDLRQQYVVSYTPSNAAHDNTFRKIEVRVAESEPHKDLKLRYRRGYYAPKA
jgi:Ca-activated chloride channel family protein